MAFDCEIEGVDNCSFAFNSEQTDVDGDDIGDACDSLIERHLLAQPILTPPIIVPDGDFEGSAPGAGLPPNIPFGNEAPRPQPPMHDQRNIVIDIDPELFAPQTESDQGQATLRARNKSNNFFGCSQRNSPPSLEFLICMMAYFLRRKKKRAG